MAAAAFALLPGRMSGQVPSAPRPTIDGQSRIGVNPAGLRLTNYLQDLAGPGAFVGVIGGGVVEHLWRKTDAAGTGGDQLSRRITQRAAEAAVQVSVRHGLAALMQRSTDYQPCECQGFGSKVEHALLETFTDRRADGSRALSVPRLAGAYAGGLSRLAWEPQRNVGDAALGTTLSLGLTAVFNIARELSGVGR